MARDSISFSSFSRSSFVRSFAFSEEENVEVIFIIQSGFFEYQSFEKKSKRCVLFIDQSSNSCWNLFRLEKNSKNNKWSQTMFVRVCVHRNRLAAYQCIVRDWWWCCLKPCHWTEDRSTCSIRIEEENRREQNSDSFNCSFAIKFEWHLPSLDNYQVTRSAIRIAVKHKH